MTLSEAPCIRDESEDPWLRNGGVRNRSDA